MYCPSVFSPPAFSWKMLLIALSCCLSFLLIDGAIEGTLEAAERPNVLIIMADDCTYNDLPVYGGQNATTPNIDQLAQQGLTFNRAYLCEAMCQPCRAELYSGQFPLRNGCAWNHSASRPSVTSMPHHLKAAGYRVGLAGKVHVKPKNVFPFETIKGFDESCTRMPTQKHSLHDLEAFMTRDDRTQGEKQPFCLVVALVEPHVPWVMGDASQYPPKKIKLPPNLADTEGTRSEYGKYLAEITYMDQQVGDILETLEKTSKQDNTLVLFTSEQGSQFPGNKWTNWDTGVHTALIAKWPNKIAAGKRTDAIVQYADVLPTLMDLAGGDASQQEYDGTSFLPVLLGKKETHRTFAYFVHNQIPEGPAYPVRSISDGEYRYILNLQHEELFIEKHLMGLTGGSSKTNPYWPSWMRESYQNPNTYRLVKRYMNRPKEEFYHTKTDAYEMNNLVAAEEHQKRIQAMREELNKWMKSQGDPGSEEDTWEALKAAKQGKHLFVPPQSE